MGKRTFQIGQKLNSLTLLAFNKSVWTVQCICGQIVDIKSNKLRRSKSCGCLNPSKKAEEATDPTITRIMNSYKFHAKERNLKWNLSRDQFKELILKDCYYCGAKPTNKSCAYSKADPKYSAGFLLTNGVDRINSQLDYEISNVCTCCRICNRAKSDMSLEDFLDWLKTIGVKYGN